MLIKVKEKDKEEVLKILLDSGKFRSLGDGYFDIIEEDKLNSALENMEKNLKILKVNIDNL